MTKGPSAGSQREDNDQSDNDIEDNIPGRIRDGETRPYMKERIDGAHPAGLNGHHNNAECPGHPNDILNAIQLSPIGSLVLNHETGFLKAGSRAGPPAEYSP